MDSSSPSTTQDHCIYCFDVLLSHLSQKQPPVFPSHLEKITCPLFVTWMTTGDELRGCIGI